MCQCSCTLPCTRKKIIIKTQSLRNFSNRASKIFIIPPWESLPSFDCKQSSQKKKKKITSIRTRNVIRFLSLFDSIQRTSRATLFLSSVAFHYYTHRTVRAFVSPHARFSLDNLFCSPPGPLVPVSIRQNYLFLFFNQRFILVTIFLINCLLEWKFCFLNRKEFYDLEKLDKFHNGEWTIFHTDKVLLFGLSCLRVKINF